jgi:hypothetical protein
MLCWGVEVVKGRLVILPSKLSVQQTDCNQQRGGKIMACRYICQHQAIVWANTSTVSTTCAQKSIQQH